LNEQNEHLLNLNDLPKNRNVSVEERIKKEKLIKLQQQQQQQQQQQRKHDGKL
jgi:hypothetical protein